MNDIKLQVRFINGDGYSLEMSKKDKLQQICRLVSLRSNKIYPAESIILIHAGKDYQFEKNKTLQELDIQNGAVFFITFKLCGGGMLFEHIPFNSLEKTTLLNFTQKAPAWRIVCKGINFLGKCSNSSCQAYNKQVWIQKGMGMFFMNKEVKESVCPICKQIASDIINFGYYHCKIKVEGKMVGANKFEFEDEHRGDSDMKSFVENEKTQLPNWQYLIIKAQPL